MTYAVIMYVEPGISSGVNWVRSVVQPTDVTNPPCSLTAYNTNWVIFGPRQLIKRFDYVDNGVSKIILNTFGRLAHPCKHSCMCQNNNGM